MRPQQMILNSMVEICQEKDSAIPQLSQKAFMELSGVIGQNIEKAQRNLTGNEPMEKKLYTSPFLIGTRATINDGYLNVVSYAAESI